MTIRHLKLFLAVAEEGSMSKAAVKLYLSQPTISQAIRELEQHYEVLLFERLGRKLYLTEAGRKLLLQAHHIVDQFEGLEQNMRIQSESPSLRLGSSITVGTCLIPSLIEGLEQVIPNIDIFSLVSNTREIEQKLLRSELDAAVVEGEIESPELVCIPIVEDCLVLFCGKNHPFYGREVLFPQDLAGQKFGMRETGSGTRKLFEQFLKEHQIPIKIVWEANCPRTIINAVMQNNILAVISIRLMKHEIMRKSVKIFCNEAGEWNRQFQLVYHKNKFLTPAILELERILCQNQKYELPEKTALLKK